MKTFNFKKSITILILIAIVAGVLWIVYRPNLTHKIFLAPKENTFAIDGSLILFEKDRVHIIEVINPEDYLSRIRDKDDSLSWQEIIPHESQASLKTYENYRFIPFKNIIVAKELEEPIIYKDSKNLSYKNVTYTLTDSLTFSEKKVTEK